MRVNASICLLIILLVPGFQGCSSVSRKPAEVPRETAIESPKQANTLRPYTTDGCSNWLNANWIECCVIHDIAYWKGGTEEERDTANDELRKCVGEKAHHHIIGKLMQWGTDLGGTPTSLTTYGWGYGWEHQRAYGPITPEEQKQIDRYMPLTRLPYQIRTAPRINGSLTALDHSNRKIQIENYLRVYLHREPMITLFAQVRGQEGRIFQVFDDLCPEAYFLISFSYKSEKVLDFKKFGTCDQ